MKQRSVFFKLAIGLIAAAGIATAAWLLLRQLAPPAPSTPSTLADLSYDRYPQFNYTVYIEENGEYQPYYVLTNRYNGQDGAALLLRKYLLDELREYHPYTREGSWSAYYENSSIDQFLNSEFLGTLTPETQASLLYSKITIADKAALASTDDITLDITRKVFLLAISELEGYDEHNVMQNEGVWLNYFKNSAGEQHIAKSVTGEPFTWWTRSASMWGTTSVWVIGLDSILGAAQTGDKFGVRPAFCLSGDLPVKTAEVAPGTQGYVIAWE